MKVIVKVVSSVIVSNVNASILVTLDGIVISTTLKVQAVKVLLLSVVTPSGISRCLLVPVSPAMHDQEGIVIGVSKEFPTLS